MFTHLLGYTIVTKDSKDGLYLELIITVMKLANTN